MSSRNYNHKTDQELLEHFYQDHNQEWLGILLQRYTLLLLGTCMKYLKNEEEAKDAVQQIFIKVLAALPRQQVSYFRSWIYMIAKNHCLMTLRNKGKQPVAWQEQVVVADTEYIDFTTLWKEDAKYEHMKTALTVLPEAQQVCIKLFYLEKQSYRQICTQTGYSMLDVKSHIQNGKRNLKIKMEQLNKHD